MESNEAVGQRIAKAREFLGLTQAVVAEKLGPKPETVRLWVRQAEKDTGRRPGATTDELAELKRLKRENAELRRANDILKAVAHFFGAELDRQHKK